MIVVDASALVEFLTDTRSLSHRIRDLLVSDPHWLAPDHMITESANALRGLWLAGFYPDNAFTQQLDAIGNMQFELHPVTPLLPRIFELAHNVTVYDAAYLALAENAQSPLLTLDRKLAEVPGSTASVKVIQ